MSVEGIRALLEPSLVSSGLVGVELWDVEVVSGTVRVLVDRPGGIDLDALSRLDSAVVSPLLDSHPELTPEGSFSLEVSSPGLERNLRRPEHFARYVGREVSVKTKVAVGGARRWQGILLSSGDSAIEVEPEGGDPVTIGYEQIDRARTVLVWGPTAKPGQATRPGKEKARGQEKSGKPAQQAGKPSQAGRQQTPVVKRPATDGPSGAGRSVAFTERAPE